MNTRFYLTQANQSFPNHLTSMFHFQLLTFFFRSTLGVHTKLDLGIFLNPHKKKMGFCTNPNSMRDWDMNEGMNQPIYCSRKSIENSFENIKRSGFSLQSKTPNWENKMRRWRTQGVWLLSPRFCSHSYRKWEKIGF